MSPEGVRRERMLAAYRERREPSAEVLKRSESGRAGKKRSQEVVGAGRLAAPARRAVT